LGSFPVVLPVLGDGGERLVFAMRDPAGDDHGPGSYVYPTNETFVPGLFDLTGFAVRVDTDHVHFDLGFVAVTNPWDAPEGFYHQLIDIYIDTTSGAGRTDPLRPGPRVRFDPAYGWDVQVRAAPFGGTRMQRASDGADVPGLARGLTSGVLADGRTIRVSIPLAVLGVPQSSWRYYVLVGGFDAFGEDGYRPARETATPWSFGGAHPSGAGPQVIDILAPRWWRSQARQLGSFTVTRGGAATGDAEGHNTYGDTADVDAGTYALLHPVGSRTWAAVPLSVPSVAALGLLALVALAVGAAVRSARGRS